MSDISPIALMLAAAACLVFAGALAVWAYGQKKADSQALNTHLQRAIERQVAVNASMDVMLSEAYARPSKRSASSPNLWVHWANIRGLPAWRISRKNGLILLLGAALIFFGVWMQAGFVLGVLVLTVYAILVIFFLWRRVSKQRQKMLEQLPGFLDNMVRLITVGNSPQAAFRMAVDSVPQPLGGALQQASGLLAASSNLGQSMAHLERSWGVADFGLLAAIFSMSTKYGGRTDLVLERVSAYIRDRLSAERELHAMSTEVRMSAWVLSLLPIVVGTLIMVLNDGYFMRMWNDASGRQMIAAAAGLEVVGVVLLYRLARLR